MKTIPTVVPTTFRVVFARDCKFHGEEFKKGEVLRIPELEGDVAEGLTLEVAVECIEFHLDMYLPDDYRREDRSPFEILPAPRAEDLAEVRREFEKQNPEVMFSWKEFVDDAA